MKSAFWRSMAVFAMVAVPMMASANDATIGSEVAHEAMLGASLMNTTALFNVFPHKTVGMGNGLETTLPGFSGGPDAMGRMWWEYSDAWTVNMTVGRGDYGAQGSNFMWGGNHIMPAGAPRWFVRDSFHEAGWVNLGVAKPTSGGGAWSANVLFANGKNTDEDDFDGDGTLDRDDEFTESGFGFAGSWGNGNGFDAQAEFGMQSNEDKDNLDQGDMDEESWTNFGFNARFDNGGRWIYQGNVSFASGEYEFTDGATTGGQNELDEFSALALLVSAGTFLKNDADGQATIEFTFAMANTTNDYTESSDTAANDEVNEGKDRMLTIPGVKIAAWQKVTDRFGLMCATEWYHAISSGEQTYKYADGATDSTYDDGNAWADFDFAIGAFMQISENVRFDAQLRDDNMDKFFSVGNDSPMIAYFGGTIGLN